MQIRIFQRKTVAFILTLIMLIPSLSVQVLAAEISFSTDLNAAESVAVGAPVTFTVEAEGAENISYQWYKDGEPINGAEGRDYTIPSAVAEDAGIYYAVATCGALKVEANQNFDGIASSTVYNQQWSLWPISLSWANGANWAATVVSRDDGDNALKLENTGSSDATELQINVNEVNNADIVDFSISIKYGDKPSDNGVDYNEQVYITSKDNAIRLCLFEGTLYSREIGGEIIATGLDGWNNYRIVSDNTEQKYHLYINGVLIQEGSVVSKCEGFQVTGKYHPTDNNGTNPIQGLFYADDVYVTSVTGLERIESTHCTLSVGGGSSGEIQFTTDLQASKVINQNEELSLNVEAEYGNNITYAWFKDGKEIPRARVSDDGKSYTVDGAVLGDSGVYQVKAASNTQPVIVAANQNFNSLAVNRKLEYAQGSSEPFCASDLQPFGLSWNNTEVGATVVAREGSDNCIQVSAPASHGDRPRLTVDIADATDAPGSIIDMRFSIKEGVSEVIMRDISSRTYVQNEDGACFKLSLLNGNLYNGLIYQSAPLIASGLTVGEWHDFRIVANNVTKKYDLYADGALIVSQGGYMSQTGVTYGLMLESEYRNNERTFYADDIFITRTTGKVEKEISSVECNVVVTAGTITVDRVEADSPVYSGDVINVDIYGTNVNNRTAVKVAVFDAEGNKVSGNIAIDTTTDPNHVYALAQMPENNGPVGDEKTYTIKVSPDAGSTYPDNPKVDVVVKSEASRPDTSTTYYVKKTGNNNNDGSQGSPFLTISKAVSAAQAGDTIIVSPGVYTETVSINKSGKENKPITITTEKASARDQFLAKTDIVAKLELTDLNTDDFSKFGDDITLEDYPEAVIVKGDQYGFLVTGSYIDIKGFFVTTNRRNVGPMADHTDSSVGINVDASKAIDRTQAVHHVNIIDNVTYRCGQSGISSFGDDSDRIQTSLPFEPSNNNGGVDYLVVKGNIVFQNSETSCWQGSGISLMGYKGTDYDTSKWHFIIEDNLCFDNSNKVIGKAIHEEWERTGGASGTSPTCPFGRQSGETDGGGIILDWLARSEAGKALVRNNILISNGGRGLCLTHSDYVVAVNNTLVDNSFSETQMYHFSEFECNTANGHIIVANNIVANTRDSNANPTRFTGSNNYLGYNLYVGEDALNGGFGTRITSVDALKFANFEAFSGVGPDLTGRTVDPLCFKLQDDSPAVGTGYSKAMADTTAKGWLSNEEFKAVLPERDFFGEDRVQMDIGAVAYEHDLNDTAPRITGVTVYPEKLTTVGGKSEVAIQGLFVDGITVKATAFIGSEEQAISGETVFSGGIASIELEFPKNETVEDISYIIKFSLNSSSVYEERTAQVTVKTGILQPPVTIYDKGIDEHMLAHWVLSSDTVDLTNGIVNDVTGNGYDGIIIGSAAFADDAPYYPDSEINDKAMKFKANAAVPSYVGIPQVGADDLKVTDVVTISAWIKINAPLGEYTKPVWVGDSANPPWGAYGFEFQSPDTGNHNIVFTTGAEKTYGAAGKTEIWNEEAFEIGDWHLVTGVFSKSEVEYDENYEGEREDDRYCQMFYVDGVLIGTKYTALPMGHYEDLDESEYLMGIGATHSGDGSVNCDIGDVRIYSAALSAKDVMELYESYFYIPEIKPSLTGTAVINNMSPKAGDTLTASLIDTNNSGELYYVWKSGGETVGTESASYVVSDEDIGKKIMVTITSSVETGSISSQETDVIAARESTPVLTGIKVNTLPVKIVYTVGDRLNLSGFVVSALYSNGNSANVTALVVTDPADGETLGTAGRITVTVSFKGFTDSFNITVNNPEIEPSITGIVVETLPNKISYEIGEWFNVTGLKIKVNYSDGNTEIITATADMVSGFSSSTSGTKKLTVTYKGFSVDFTVAVRSAGTGPRTGGSAYENNPSSSNTGDNAAKPPTGIMSKDATSKIIEDAVKNGKDKAVITLDSKTSGIEISGEKLLGLAKNNGVLDVTRKDSRYTVRITQKHTNEWTVEEKSTVQIVVTPSEAQLDKAKIEQMTKVDEINSKLLKEIHHVGFKINNKTISTAATPTMIIVDVSDLKLTSQQKTMFTGFCYNEKTKEFEQLGGEFSKDGKTFIFYTYKTEEHGVMITDNLLKLNFKIGSSYFHKNGAAHSNDVAPYISNNNRTMLPVRTIAEALGAEVGWIAETRTVTLTKDGKTVQIQLDTPLSNNIGMAVIVGDRTFVPIRYIAETLGAHVIWDDDDNSVNIYQ